jgi:hypothetical protein
MLNITILFGWIKSTIMKLVLYKVMTVPPDRNTRYYDSSFWSGVCSLCVLLIS